MTMKKCLASIIILVVMLVYIPVFGSAMTNQELAEKQQQMRENLSNTPEVTYDDLKSNPTDFSGNVYKFHGKVVGVWNPSIIFEDKNGNLLVITVPTHYKLKLGQEYEISGTFSKMMYLNADGVNKLAAVFTYEDSHLPFMTEFSDFYK